MYKASTQEAIQVNITTCVLELMMMCVCVCAGCTALFRYMFVNSML